MKLFINGKQINANLIQMCVRFCDLKIFKYKLFLNILNPSKIFLKYSNLNDYLHKAVLEK